MLIGGNGVQLRLKDKRLMHMSSGAPCYGSGLFSVWPLILLHDKFLQFYCLRAVVFQLNLKYLHEKITNLLWVVV